MRLSCLHRQINHLLHGIPFPSESVSETEEKNENEKKEQNARIHSSGAEAPRKKKIECVIALGQRLFIRF